MNLAPRRNRREAGALARPETGLTRFRSEIDNIFNRFLGEPWGGLEGIATPRADVAETDKEVKISMELPGIDPKEVEISVAGGILTVRGEKKQEREEEHRDYFCVERQFGSFQRAFQLPSSVDPDKVDAQYKNGVLRVTLAKQPQAQAKRIPVKTT
jgi:HSP20 family protein